MPTVIQNVRLILHGQNMPHIMTIGFGIEGTKKKTSIFSTPAALRNRSIVGKVGVFFSHCPLSSLALPRF
jgi:hypothetical protein